MTVFGCARHLLCSSLLRKSITSNIIQRGFLTKQQYSGLSSSFLSEVQIIRSQKWTNNIKSQNGQQIIIRTMSKMSPKEAKHRQSVIIYVCAAGIFMFGMSYAGVPLYRMFCQATGLGGQAVQGHNVDKVENMSAIKDRVLSIRFNADVASSMRWNFKPLQTEVKVVPGETALAFYTAKNPSDKPVIGISTYNVVPFEAGQYFNKIQCFCFEEQRLNPHEQVDMPVFFYIDPDFAEDPKLETCDTITLSYTFFEAKEGIQIPVPGFMAS